MMATQLNLHDRILKNRTAIMKHKSFIAMAGLLMVGGWEISDTVPTAMTNGLKVIYGRKFMETLDDEEMRFLILHEYFHVMFKHMLTWKHLWEKDAQLANIAADVVINNYLDNLAQNEAKGFIKMPANGAMDHKYDGLDTGEVFRRLQQQQQQQQQDGGGSGGTPKPNGFDEHDFSGAAPGDGEDGKDGKGKPHRLTEQEVEQLGKIVDEVIRQGAQIAGKMGGNLDRTFTDLLEVKIPWEDQLRDFVTTTAQGGDMSTWRRPSRRWMSRGVYMPSHISEAVDALIVTIDTSGSIGQDDLTRFMTEVKGICDSVNPQRVHVLYWDTRVARHEIYEGEDIQNIAQTTKPAGGGGTCIGAALQYIKDNALTADCIINFTDGYVESDWGQSVADGWPTATIFCVTTKGVSSPVGKTLHVEL